MAHTMTQQSVEIPAALANLYQELAISPVMLLRNYALTQVYTMLQKYSAENTYFKNKYGCEFPEFQAKVDRMEDEECFEWEDDVMDWQFAVENITFWQQKGKEIEAS